MADQRKKPGAVTSRETPDAGEAFLRGYDPSRFPAFAVTVDLAVFTVRAGLLQVLLVQRAQHPFRGCWALPGGFVGEYETVEAAARRELEEETGLTSEPGHLEQLATYGDPDRDPRMRILSVAHVALVPEPPHPTPGGDVTAARFWPVEDLALEPRDDDPEAPPLAFDHARILHDAVERVGSKLEYTTLATAFVSEPFSLADLRRVYRAVWGNAPDVANFRRKVLSTDGFVIPVEETAEPTGRGGRPAMLYRAGPATFLHPAMLRSDGFS